MYLLGAETLYHSYRYLLDHIQQCVKIGHIDLVLGGQIRAKVFLLIQVQEVALYPQEVPKCTEGGPWVPQIVVSTHSYMLLEKCIIWI